MAARQQAWSNRETRGFGRLSMPIFWVSKRDAKPAVVLSISAHWFRRK